MSVDPLDSNLSLHVLRSVGQHSTSIMVALYYAENVVMLIYIEYVGSMGRMWCE